MYNRADERATFPQAASAGPELTRLPGSARELKRCAGAWSLDAAPSLITGRNACRRALRQELRRGPAVLHLGVHVVQHPAAPEEVMLALGTSSGEPEYLTPAEISTWRHPLGLVTLSGCSSGAGRFRPGLGLFGLTRAWLAAGAASVVASYWPIRDDDGQLLATMYSELSKHGGSTRSRDVARALQEAQNRSKRRNDWQAQPSYWAAFFVVGKE